MTLRFVPNTFTLDEQRQEINNLASDVNSIDTDFEERVDDRLSTLFPGLPTISLNDTNNWNTAYEWGDHATQGYLTSYTETDPLFTSSIASGITLQNFSNWTTAYNWGDHSQVGYLTNLESSSINELSNVVISGPVSNQLLRYNGTNWVNFTPDYISSTGSIDSHTDVTITSPIAGQLLQYNGSVWENVSGNFLNSYAETDTLATVTARGSNTDVSCTFLNLTVSENLTVLGTTTQNNVTTLNVTNNEIVINEGQASGSLNATIRNERGTDSDVSIRWNEVQDRWQFTNDGSTYYNFAISTSDLTNDSGYLTSIGSIDNHTDVTLSSLQDNQLLKYNIGAGRWENWTPDYITSYGSVNDLTDVIISSPSNGQILQYNGSEWVNAYTSSTATVTVSENPPPNPVPGGMWWKSNEGSLKIFYNDGNSSQWVDASPIGDPFETIYNSVSFFPGANVNEGSFAYSQATGSMYYSNGVSWTSQRLVTTNNSNTSDFATLLANTQLVYSIDLFDGINSDQKIIKLADDKGVQTDVILEAGDGISLVRSSNKVTFVNDNNFTYNISSEVASGSNAILRLGRSDGTNDDIIFAGVDGLVVENTNANIITFRAPDISAQLYSDEKAQDAVAQMFINGIHENISFVYDDINNVINVTTQATSSGGGTTYDLVGSNTTSNNAIITLVDANTNEDSIEITGTGGTSVNWDGVNDKITISSTAPVNADWNATSGLAQILNKPTIPVAYTLPIASNSVLGGFKVGANLTIDPTTGVLDANPGAYTLPTASETTLGGIKIGSGLSIDGNGVVNATGGSTVPSIQDLSGTTSSIPADETVELNITGYKAYSLFKVTTDAEAWVRIYVDDASRDADSTRSEGEDPTPGGGVISEVRTTGAESVLITPGIMGFNNDSPRTDTIYLAVTNRSGAATTITVTLTALQIGE